jgi:DNA invertase Pin-like site-specific DNA recombinase
MGFLTDDYLALPLPSVRQAQGQAKAKAEGKYKGRAEDVERNAGIARMLATGQSWGMIQSVTGCSRATISKIAKRIKQAA